MGTCVELIFDGCNTRERSSSESSQVLTGTLNHSYTLALFALDSKQQKMSNHAQPIKDCPHLCSMPDIYDVLCYPERGRNKKLKETFDNLGVDLIPFGEKRIFGVPVLGKGWSSVVVYGRFHNKKVAVKIQRTDSNRISLGREAFFLRITNRYRIGPHLYYEGDNFLILEYLDGIPIKKVPIRKSDILSFFEQCHKLDLLKIDHGQIQGGKHLIIGKKCWIIDFEKAGHRTPRNVSSFVSEVFLKKTKYAKEVTSAFRIDRERLIEATRQYKKTFDITSVLNALHLNYPPNFGSPKEI